MLEKRRSRPKGGDLVGMTGCHVRMSEANDLNFMLDAFSLFPFPTHLSCALRVEQILGCSQSDGRFATIQLIPEAIE